MAEPTWWTYFKRTAGTETGRVIAEAAGVSEPQVSRWKTGKNRPDAESVVRFARYYKRPPVEALIAAGYIDAHETSAPVQVVRHTADMDDDELLAEIKRRLEDRHADQPPTPATPPASPARTPRPENQKITAADLGLTADDRRPLDDDDALWSRLWDLGYRARDADRIRAAIIDSLDVRHEETRSPREWAVADLRRKVEDKLLGLSRKDQGAELDRQSDYELVARTGRGPSERERFDAAQDAAAEAPDPEGPEDGA